MARSDEVFEEASTSVKEYVDSVEPIKKQRKQRRLKRKIMIAVLGLAVVGAAAWFFLLREPKAEQPAQSAQPETQQTADEPEEEVVTTTENYVSQTFSLTLDYPTNWEIDDSDGAELIIVSPETRVQGINDKSNQKVRVLVRIRAKNSPLAEFTANSLAIRASEKMSYAQPSSAQRGQTFLTFVSHKAGGLEGVYITGDNGYEKDGFVPKADVAQADPIISISVTNCDEPGCDITEIPAMSIEPGEWDTNKYLQQAKTILQSFVIS